MNGKNYPVVSKQMLLKSSLEVCEFCEEAFTNRYDSLIHNATHIIIPIIRQNLVVCSKCDYECASQNDLHQHIITEHPLIIKTEKLNLWDIKEENHAIDQKLPENDDVEEVKFISNNNLIEIQEDDCSEAGSDLIITNESNSSLDDIIEIVETISSPASKKMPSFKDRLVFESDDDVDTLSDSGCVEEYQPTMLDNTATKLSFDFNVTRSVPELANKVDSPLMFKIVNQNAEILPDEYNYHSLMRPNTLFCRYCSAMFLERFTLIVHEQKHIKFKNKIMGMLCLHCDKYIAGNYTHLSKHIDAKHSKDKYKVYCTSVCKKCGLQYRSYKHHIHNYHFTKCCNINKFVTDNHFKNHLDKCLCHTHVLSVCPPCNIALKEDNNFKCMTLGIKHLKGVLQECKKCNRKVNEIISVKLSCKIQSQYQCWYVQDKPLSNKDRLKNIRMRLKKLNILSKMYCFVLIFVDNNNLVLN
ncbi:uncharacterized protein LOC121725501 [Aricia agestis]|uniref:uncharacterized protein LOC121725501 n=1 Tax=Aricia agestis TaxID=91739 RepID=UPI001C20987E|nr:uncharacterized protein LOC121725501 [Aricia agestis]